MISLEEVSPVWDIIDDTIISKKGDLSLVYKATFPELYMLSSDDYNSFHSIMTKGINMLPEGVIVQRIDFFYPEGVKTEPITSSFIDRANCSHWGERKVVSCETFFVFTRIAKIEKKTYYNTVLNSSKAAFNEQQFDLENVSLFKIAVSQFIEGFTTAFTHPAKKVFFEQLATFEKLYEFVFERYLYLGIEKAKKNLSTSFSDSKTNAVIGDDLVTILSMNSDGYPPILHSTKTDIETAKENESKIEFSMLHRIGYNLDFPHVLVNCIYTLNQIEEKERLTSLSKQFQSLQGTAYNNEKLLSINTFLSELSANPTVKVVQHHFGLLVATPSWEKELHNKRVSQASSALGNLDIRFSTNSLNTLNYFFSYCPGNANDIAMCDRGHVPTGYASCFNIFENNQRSFGKGVRFLDRKFSTPVMVDLWNYPGIENRNMLVVAPSGKGKSFTLNHIVSYLLNDALDAVIVDVGNSYKKLGLLNDCVYIEATENNPLNYNPFLSMPKDERGKYIVRALSGDDTDPLTPIITILFKAWQSDRQSEMTSAEYTVFSATLIKYYAYLNENPEIKPSYNTFHPFLIESFLDAHGEEYRLFDIGSYKLVMEMFLTGGQFGDLFNCEVNPEYFNSNLVIFELGGIESNKILFNITYTLIMQIVLDKMMRKSNKRKLYLIMDEVWKILNSSMEGFIKFMFKTARKHDGGIGVITQEISDILGSSVGRAIIGNSDIKLLLQHSSDQVNTVITRELALTEQQRELANGIRITPNYREVFFKFGAENATIYKIEVSPETAKVFTSKKEENHEIFDEIEKSGNIEVAIKNIVEKSNPLRYINPNSII